MAKQLGRALLVKIDDGGGNKSNLCGLNSKSLTINNSSIDVTTPDCTSPEGALYTETLAGLKNVSVSGDGFFEDSTAEARMNTVAMAADNSTTFEVVVPDFGTYAGTFRITSVEFGGETEGGVTYSLSLESSGAVTFTAA
ncbi:phage major tail protein, TP901-1 family [Alphaproteobacteria bacterium US3C007]|nr:phage major tail protein, TP901-1 family [Alphaproteobacteria bacterium US3C007]